MRKCLYTSMALMLATVVAGCGGSKGQSGVASSGGAGSSKQYAELHWGYTDWSGAIDTTKDPYFQSISISRLVVQSLVELEPSGKTKPGLASSIEQPNATTYVYHIRRGVRFSNGKPLTSADVVYSLDRNIVDKEAWTTSYWTDVASVSASGESTVVVKLKHPNAVWEYTMAGSSPIIEKAQGEKGGEKELGTPSDLLIGTGPWKFDSYKPEVSVQLSRNPYWNGPPQPAARVSISIFKDEASLALALRSGAIDGACDYAAPNVFADIPGTRQLTAPGSSVSTLAIGTSQPPLNDVHVRRAIAYAADANGMIKALYDGDAVKDVTIAPNDFFAGLGSASQVNEVLGALPKYEFNLAAAKRELAKSAYPHGFTTSIQVEASSSSASVIAQSMASNLAKIGITAKIQELQPSEAANLSATAWRNVKIDLTEYTYNYPDPEDVMVFILASSEIGPYGTNAARYRNPEVDKLLQEEIEALNPTRRLHLIGKLLKIVATEAPYVPLYTRDLQCTLSNRYVLPTFSTWTPEMLPWALDVKLAS
jgi:peptide/nickel transport system substrate-binding protein